MDEDRQRVDELRGIVPSLNTPFRDDGSVDQTSTVVASGKGRGLFTNATCRAGVPVLDRFQQSEADQLSARYRALVASGLRPS